jgi:hypothetical protein
VCTITGMCLRRLEVNSQLRSKLYSYLPHAADRSMPQITAPFRHGDVGRTSRVSKSGQLPCNSARRLDSVLREVPLAAPSGESAMMNCQGTSNCPDNIKWRL